MIFVRAILGTSCIYSAGIPKGFLLPSVVIPRFTEEDNPPSKRIRQDEEQYSFLENKGSACAKN